jgi:hypothetical protein
MRKVSLFRGEPLWNSEGVHEPDGKGSVKFVEDEHIVIEMNVEDYERRVLPCIDYYRKNNCKIRSTEKQTIRLTNEISNIPITKNTFVVPSLIDGFFRIKYNQNICEHCVGTIDDKDITFDDIYINKTRKKTKQQKVPVFIDVIETKTIEKPVFNEETNRWELTSVEEQVTVKKYAEDTFDLYDKNGTIIGTHTVPRTTTEEVDVLDEYSQVMYEEILDENGNPEQIQKYNKQYINKEGTLISKEEYDLNGGWVVIDCVVNKICPVYLETCLS